MSTQSESLFEHLELRQGPILRAELLGRDAYEHLRPELLTTALGIKRSRRLSLGRAFTLLFENRVTVWLQIQEELRMIPNPDPVLVDSLLTRCNVLVADPDDLRASLFLDTTDPMEARWYLSHCTVERLGLGLNLKGWRVTAEALEPDDGGLDSVTFLRFVPTSRSYGDEETIDWWHEVHEHTRLPPKLRAELSRELFLPALQGNAHASFVH